MNELMIWRKKKSLGSKFNPSKKGTDVTLSEGDRLATFKPTGHAVLGAIGRTSGNWYFEMISRAWEGSAMTFSPLIGFATATTNMVQPWSGAGQAVMFYPSARQLLTAFNFRENYNLVNVKGDRIGLLLSLNGNDATFQFSVNGVVGTRQRVDRYYASPGNYEWFPIASSPQAAGTNDSTTEFVDSPLYLPTGYQPW